MQNELFDPAKDVYWTKTPYGIVKAIFTDDVPGVTFDGPPFATYFMRDHVNQSRGESGVCLDAATITQDAYYWYCQSETIPVKIEAPWNMRDVYEDGGDGLDVALDSAIPINLGPVFTEYKDDPEGAIARLMKEHTGDARAVWTRQGIGAIDLIWGGDRFGLAKIMRKHPEAISKLPNMLRHGRIVRTEGSTKVFLIDDKQPLHVTVISLDYMGTIKAWVVTSYDDDKGRFAGRLATVDTKTLDASEMDCRPEDLRTEPILDHGSVNVDPVVGGAFTGGLKTMNTGALDSAQVDILYAGQRTEYIFNDIDVNVKFDSAAVSPLLDLRARFKAAQGVLAKLALAKEILAARLSAKPEEESTFGLTRGGLKTREKINSQVAALVDQIRAGKDPKTLTSEEIDLFKQYSGRGGLTENSQYEYYTPTHVAEGVWDLMKANGYTNGNILEPSCGAGVFFATKPTGTALTGAEIDPTAATVNQVLHPEDTTLNQSFEKLAVSAPDNHFDAVIGNVPFGDARGASAADDPAYKHEKRIERYFVNRVIDKTRPGGLITLVVPIGVIGGKDQAWKKFRAEISRKAEFLGGHKLPSKTFGKQGTDVVTDIIVLRKHPADLLAKVDSLPTETLAAANVLWDEFISGQYWQGEGRRFIHGQYVPPDASKIRSMEQVIPADGHTPEALKRALAVHFDSRIDWQAVDSAEPTVQAYAKGDRRVINGKESEFDGLAWHEVRYEESVSSIDAGKYGAASIEALRDMLVSPESMLSINNQQAFRIYKDYPNLLNPHIKAAVEFAQSQPTDEFREQAWRGSLIGSVVTTYIAKANNGNAEDGDRQRAHALVEKEFALFGHPRSIKGFYLEGESARYFGAYLTAINEQGKVSDVISGGVTEAAGFDATNPLSVIEHLVKGSASGELSLDEIKAAYAGGRTFGSLGDLADVDGVAITPDGMVTTTKNYCCGDIYVKSAQLMGVMEGEADPRLKAKFQAQIDAMFAKARRTDIGDISFGLRDKWIAPKYKIEFLKSSGFEFKYVVDIEKTSDTGEKYMGKGENNDSTDPNGDFVRSYSKAGGDFGGQLEGYMNGKSIANNVRDKQGEDAAERADRFREQVSALEEQFKYFMQTHGDFQEIESTYNRTFNNYVKPEYDDGDLGLIGVSANVRTHSYQNQAVRQLSAEGTGVLGFDVGLGKTFSALAFSKYDRQMGRSNKHCIVVPKSVLANWYQESKKMLGNHDGVMFVGFEPKRGKDGSILTEPILDENGQPKKNQHTGELEFQDMLVEDSSTEVYAKMHQIPQLASGIVVMTYEKYATIPMREENRLKYAEKWAQKSMMSGADLKKLKGGGDEEKKRSYAEDKKKNRDEGKYADDGTRKKGELPYFEDMGFDRVIVDEAHSFKNSFSMGGDTQQLAYLPNPVSSQRARDMAMKTSFLREKFAGKGTILLTATPVANSPIEIFNMLSLVIDPAEFERYGVYTPDDFVRQFGIIKMVDKAKVSGEVKPTEGLGGFRNLNALRNLFHRYANMKNAKDVDPDGNTLKLPESAEALMNVTLTDYQMQLYVTLREEAKKAANPQARMKDPSIRPMFAVIRDMDRVTTDIDLYRHTVTFLFKASDEAKIKAMIAALPAALKMKIVDEDTGEKDEIDIVKETEYHIDGDTLTYVAPEMYEDAIVGQFPKLKIDYANHPLMPKYAKLMENMQGELATKGKQIVFTEEKSQHGKLARLIENHLPVTRNQIAIINADTAGGEKLQQISDAYNRGDVRIIVANKKAEVGVNLQKGTTAIHHLTLPWNPASIQQRNGRGVRQGNTAKQVRVYYYMGTGSFDEYRLDLLKAKGNWIASLMDKDNDNDTADNAEAMGAIEQAALLADNREEFVAKMNEQKAKKDAEAKEKREKGAKVKLAQLAALAGELTRFDANLAAAKAKADEDIVKAETKLQWAQSQTGEDREELVKRATGNLGEAKLRRGKIDAAWEQKRADLETKQKQTAAFLRGAGAKGELPFDVALVERPQDCIITRDGLVAAVGKTFLLKNPAGKTQIARITGVDSVGGGIDIEMLVGRYLGHYDVYTTSAESALNGAVEVSYTPDEIEVMKMLQSTFTYADLGYSGYRNIRALGKDRFLQYRDQLKTDGAFLVRSPEGKLDWQRLLGGMEVVWPDENDQALLAEMVAAYKSINLGSNGVEYYLQASFDSAAKAIYGAQWKDILLSRLSTAKREDILAMASAIIQRQMADKPQGTTGEMRVLMQSLDSYRQTAVNEIAEWMKSHEYINVGDIAAVARDAVGAIMGTLNEKLVQLRAEQDRIAAETLKADPNYFEIPAETVAKFNAIGIEAMVNREAVKIGRDTFAPFAQVFLQDRNGFNGRLRNTKEILKARFDAKWTGKDASVPKYLNCWRIPAKSDLAKVLDVLA